MNSDLSGPKAYDVIARPAGPGNAFHKISQGLKGRNHIRASRVPPFQGGVNCLGSTSTWGFTPGCHIAGFQP